MIDRSLVLRATQGTVDDVIPLGAVLAADILHHADVAAVQDHIDGIVVAIQDRPQVRTLSVIQDRFVIGIRRGCINLPGYTFPGQVAILRVKLLAESSGYLFEVFRGFQPEAAKKNAAMLIEFPLDLFAVVTYPVGQIGLLDGRLQD